jgi:hypothetical protein
MVSMMDILSGAVPLMGMSVKAGQAHASELPGWLGADRDHDRGSH